MPICDKREYTASRWRCNLCKEWKLKEDFYYDGIDPFGSNHCCRPCEDKRTEEFKAEWIYKATPEGQAELQKKREEKEAKEKKDLEDSYYFYESYCPSCGKANGRYVKNGVVITKDFWCGCYERTEFDSIRH